MTEEELDRLFRALGDATRRRIIDRLIHKGDQSLFEICSAAVAEGEAVLTRQAISQHLDMLEKAGLVTIEWAGRVKLHRLNRAPLREAYVEWLEPRLGAGQKRSARGNPS